MEWIKNLIKKIFAWVVNIPQDKLLHDYAAALITLFAFALAKLPLPYWWAFGVADALALAALILKECYDAKHEGHSVELSDILWGVFGIVKIDLALLLLLPSIG